MPPRGDLRVNSRLVLKGSEIAVESARSGGPGGQNVNRRATKVILRFSVEGSASLGERRRAILREALRGRLNRRGEVVIHASRHRDRIRNEEDARERLAALLRGALAPRKRRRPTRAPASAARRRLAEKRIRGERKRGRGPVSER